jgi:hypothetical protein
VTWLGPARDLSGRPALGKRLLQGTPSKEHPLQRARTKGKLMVERDLSLPDADDDDVDAGDAVEKHRMRSNPSRTTKLESAEGTRIRYNPSRSSSDDSNG